MDQDQGDMASAGAFLLDLSFVVTAWDSFVAACTGIAASEAVGKNIFELLPNLSRQSVSPRLERVRDLGTTEILSPALHGFLIPCPPDFESKHFDKMQQLVTISSLGSDQGRYGISVHIEDVTARLETDRELARRLKDPEDSVRMGAAKEFLTSPAPLSSETTHAAIGALGDSNWRIRRKLIEGLAAHLTSDAAAALLQAVGEDHSDFGLLNSAVQILQNSSIDTTGTLIEFLHSPDADLRVQAALLLGQQRNKAAVTDLIRALGNEGEDDNVRAHAIEALGKIGSSEAVEPLLTIAKTGHFFLAFSALVALKMIGNTAASRDIVPLLDDSQLREVTAEALGAIGDVQAVEPIIRLLNTGELLASQAVTAVVEIYTRYDGTSAATEVVNAVRSSIAESGIVALAGALKSGNPVEVEPAAAMAGWISDPLLTRSLDELLDNEELRGFAIRGLVKHGPAALPFLAQRLRSGAPDVKSDAAFGLADMRSIDAVKELIAALQDPNAAAAAAEALSDTDDLQAAEAVIGSLALSREPKERASFVRILGKLRIGDRLTPILNACDDPDLLVRIAALEQLPTLNADSAADRLARSLQDDCPQVRAAAARVLGTVQTDHAIEALRSALRDSDAWTRYFAVRSLGALNDLEGLELIKLVSENDAAEQVRVAAAEVLSGANAI